MFTIHVLDVTGNDTRTYLLVAVDNKLLLQDLIDVFQQPQVLYEDSNKSVVVTGITHQIHTVDLHCR